MFGFLKSKVSFAGSVFYRGSIPPRATDMGHLQRHGIHITARQTPDVHWAFQLRHPVWGDAVLVCLRNLPRPPELVIKLSMDLSEAEIERALRAESAVQLMYECSRGNLLRDRKYALRYLAAVMADDGLVAMDHLSQRLWSRAALDDELSHDADLDIESLYAIHAVQCEDGESRWLHTHGLAEIGAFDFDIINPSPEITSTGVDILRACAFAISEGHVSASTPRFTLVRPGGNVRFVPVADFNAHAEPYFVNNVRDSADPEHNTDRAVICEPAGGLLGRWSKKIAPSKFFAREPTDDQLIQFSQDASDLMAQRARNTYALFRAFGDEVRELGLPVIAKLGYQIDGGAESDREHLWFEVHECLDDHVDASLASTPVHIARLKCGQRDKHPISLLSDWAIVTPGGMITPRSTRLMRFVRENRERLLAAMKKRD